MKKKVTFLMLAFIAVFASLSLGSCDKKDEPQNVGDYYFQLYNVQTNLVNEDGQNLADALYQEWITNNNADSQGRISLKDMTRETAEASFDLTINELQKGYEAAYAGKDLLPQGGLIVYQFTLLTSSGSRIESASIQVTNDGAIVNN